MSFVSTLVTDKGTIEHPTWEDVEGAIQDLDAESATVVMLAPAPPLGAPEGDRHMGIGGGKDDKCIVYLTEDNLHFWNLEDPTSRSAAKPVRMLVGGQEGEFCEGQCVPREWAMKAAREYFESGGRAAGLNWIEG